MPTHTGTALPVSGWRTSKPVGMPRFSCVASSASIAGPRLHSSMNAASAGLPATARVASGCSAATAQNVTPMTVSARVVKARSTPCSVPMSYGKPMRTPWLLPIQLACMARTRSGQPCIPFSDSSRSSA